MISQNILLASAASCAVLASANAKTTHDDRKLEVATGGPINLEIVLPLTPGDGVASKPVIVGGSVASQRYPWLSSLQAVSKNRDGVFYHQCGGVLIAPHYILTAAHCETAFNRACLGGINLENLGSEFECHDIEEHIVHPNFDHATFENDVQIVKLRTKSKITPISLNRDPANTRPGTAVRAAGWGISDDSNGGASQQLR